MEQAGLHDITPKARTGLSVTVDSFVWLAVIGAGAGIRLAGLGEGDLTVAESQRALDALRVATGEVPEAWVGDTAGAAVAYLFDAFGESATLARLPSAIAGAVLIAALWLMRPFAGRAGSLVAAALVSLSPMFVLFSRSPQPYAFGPAIGAMAAVSLLWYLRSPGPGWLFSLALFTGLALLTDPVSTVAVAALALTVGLESLLGTDEIRRAWSSFRRSPTQWAVVAVVAAATLQLGLTHYGTSTEKAGLAGLTLFSEMFQLPRDSRPPEYHGALLLFYEWPVVLAGVSGLALLVRRAAGRGLASLTAFERLVLVWTALAAVTIAFATRREAGQTLVLLLPLALVGGAAAETLAQSVRWERVTRWWPTVAGLLVFAGGGALLMTQWSAGNATGFERGVMIAFAAAGGALALGMLAFGRAAGAASMAIAIIAIGIAFAAHSSLVSVSSGGVELAEDSVLLERRHDLKRTIDTLAREREGLVVIDPGLQEALAWTLRDSPYLFGGSLEEASVFVGPAGEAPEGFVAIGGEWQVAESWYPEAIAKPRSMWRWLLYREPYGGTETVAVQVYVPTI